MRSAENNIVSDVMARAAAGCWPGHLLREWPGLAWPGQHGRLARPVSTGHQIVTHHTTLGQGFPGGSVSHRVQPQPSQGDIISGDAETRGSDAEDRVVTTVTRTRTPAPDSQVYLPTLSFALCFTTYLLI